MKLSSFSVILTFVILMIVGAALLPLVDVGTEPQNQRNNRLVIRCEWPQRDCCLDKGKGGCCGFAILGYFSVAPVVCQVAQGGWLSSGGRWRGNRWCENASRATAASHLSGEW